VSEQLHGIQAGAQQAADGFLEMRKCVGENPIFQFVINFTRLAAGNSLQSTVSGLQC
jgi:hypothetical protein